MTVSPPSQAVPVRMPPTPANDEPVGSPLWWVNKLEAELNARATLTFCYEDAYEGRHNLSFATSKYRESFAQMLAAVSDNWLPLIVNAPVERLKPQGFIFEEGTAADTLAWNIWQANYLDADAKLGFTEAGKHGESYLLIWPSQEPKGTFGRLFSRRSSATPPQITIEHPSQMIVARSPSNHRLIEAALKVWQEGDGSHRATLYLPDKIYYFERRGGAPWTSRDPVEANNPLGAVPVVPLVNNPHLLPCRPPLSLTCAPHNVHPAAFVGLGRSDMADAISTVYEINKYLCDMLVASEVSAFKQRWATGLEVPKNEETGEPEEPFKAAVDRIWIAEGEAGKEAKFGEFSASDLRNFTIAIEQRVGSLASRTQTPPSYFPGQSLSNINDRALKTTEARFASKVVGKQDSYGEGLTLGMRYSLALMGERDKAADYTAAVSWAPAEVRSDAEVADSLVKKLALGVPKEQLWADAGYSPQQIQRFKGMLLEEAMQREIGVPDVTPPDEQPEGDGTPAAG